MTLKPLKNQVAQGSLPDRTVNTLRPEAALQLPWVLDPVVSWFDYLCWVEVHLDAGMVLHKPLPSVMMQPDTLATAQIGDPALDTQTPPTGKGGVHLVPRTTIADVVQRMATSTYTFQLKGWGIRVGYQIPIPGLVSLSGIPFVPGPVQRAYNMLIGNLSGIPYFYAAWELHYFLGTVSNSEGNVAPVPANPALHIQADVELPQTIQVPWTDADQRHTYPATPLTQTNLGQTNLGQITTRPGG